MVMSKSYENFSDGRKHITMASIGKRETVFVRYGSVSDSGDDDDDLKKYHFQYKIRYQNPKRFENSLLQLEEFYTSF